MRRRRSKNFVKLSGKRTVTGLYSGEHAHVLSVTDGEPSLGKTLRYNRQRQRWIRPPLSLSLFLPQQG